MQKHIPKFERNVILEEASGGLSLAYAGAGDLREIASFLDSCWREAYLGILSDAYLDALDSEDRYRGLLSRFQDGEARFLVLREKSGELAGASVFGKSATDEYPDDGEVSAIYLRADHIGFGYGHTLFSAAETELAKLGYANFVLDVFTENARALRFYQNHGYRVMCEKAIEFGGRDYPYVILRKELRILK